MRQRTKEGEVKVNKVSYRGRVVYFCFDCDVGQEETGSPLAFYLGNVKVPSYVSPRCEKRSSLYIVPLKITIFSPFVFTLQIIGSILYIDISNITLVLNLI